MLHDADVWGRKEQSPAVTDGTRTFIIRSTGKSSEPKRKEGAGVKHEQIEVKEKKSQEQQSSFERNSRKEIGLSLRLGN
ncbi:hypothetical protein GWI33_013556 [Rhynchophorus ferrugineus]|uniref:Uncharacterized protein n=1 Tax=Rhynchophorus ferrugineus TaxID=354439 RepID=A0A834I349_RHYFE|nr:hypothetical protein GWI33_013556 [Rhynchophorus ferrugineus]